MRISVIIPVYNAENYIKDSLSSIINQTFEELEILIYNDASTDASVDIISSIKDPRIKLFQSNKNEGYLKTINKLFQLTTGDYIAFHDADDISHKKRLELQVEYLEKKRLDLVGSNHIVIDEKGKHITKLVHPVTSPAVINRLLITKNLFQKPSILFKAPILKSAGYFREEFLQLNNISEDYDWLLRVQEAGFKMGNLSYKDPLYLYRSVPTAMTKDFNHIEQLFGEKTAQFLAQERRKGKKDSIERGDFETLNNLIQRWKLPYLKSRSLFFIERSQSLMYQGLYTQAIKYATTAVLKSPLSFKNWRTLQYCIRKKYLRI